MGTSAALVRCDNAADASELTACPHLPELPDLGNISAPGRPVVDPGATTPAVHT